MPRTSIVHFTPACDASMILSMISLSVTEFVLKNSPDGSPAWARAIWMSMLRRMFCLICSGATQMMSYSSEVFSRPMLRKKSMASRPIEGSVVMNE